MPTALRLKIRQLGTNLGAGLRLAGFRRVPRVLLHTGSEQIVLLAILGAAAFAAADRLAQGPHASFNPTALVYQGYVFSLLLAALYLGTRLMGRPGLLAPLLTAVLAIDVWFALAWVAVHGAGLRDAQALSHLAVAVIEWGLTGWHLAAVAVAVIRVAGHGARRWLAGPLVVLLQLGALWYGPLGRVPFFSVDPRPRSTPDIDVEATYYAQPRRLAEALAGLAPQRSGRTDIYTLGFAGWAHADVFRNEIDYLAGLAKRRLGGSGRMLSLVNHPATVDTRPLASVHNLARALDALGDRMDPAEDVLFLYLTSHGERDGRLAVAFDPLGLNDLTAGRLAGMLDEAGIRWRVVVISACFSGSFIEALSGPRTLVMTAAAADRMSFGCGTRSEFTYFGDALLRQAMPTAGSLKTAFERARASVKQREAAEDKRPSKPQLFIGEAIRPRLGELLRPLPEPKDGPAD